MTDIFIYSGIFAAVVIASLLLGLLVGYHSGLNKGLATAAELIKNPPKPKEEKPKTKNLTINDVIRMISDANPTRHYGNLHRRMIKVMEELGEASEAYLNVTSAANGKNLSWIDVREELVDLVVVAVDCALTPMPDQVNEAKEDIEAAFVAEMIRKLAKWKRNRDTGKAATDAE